MYHQENIQKLNNQLHAFPHPDEIFVPEQAWLKTHFLPLISIDLAIVNPEWQGRTVHMLNPFEPYEGYIGEGTEAHHNAFTAPNWLAFRLTDDNRYEFLGNEGFFMRSPLNQDNPENYYDKEYARELAATHQASQAQATRDGFLIFPKSKPFQGEPNITNFLDELGGGFSYGNWTESAAIPPAFEMHLPPDGTTYDELDKLPNNGIEITYQGQPFYHIGNVAGYNYCGSGADAIILMYEPVSRIVLFTFDYG